MSPFLYLLCTVHFLLGFLPFSVLMAQDELYLRELFSGGLGSAPTARSLPSYNEFYSVFSDLIQIDLNNNGRREMIAFEKSDGRDFLLFFDHQRKVLAKFELTPKGIDSHVLRMSKRQLNEQTDVFLIFYDEGRSSYRRTRQTHRLYFVTIDNRDLKTISFAKGSSLSESVETRMQGDWERFYHIELRDLNKNGTNELIVSHGRQTDIYHYAGSGRWIKL